mmetsp:Transcript_35573/g.83125  ORF Transcript_35573/g.83125 Transcript_35573/m.83125 type:complete len:387 (-) Transcript_35573:8-1168(-)
MLSQIRAFEAERQEWEAQRDALLKEKAELQEEARQLREGAAVAPAAAAPQVGPSPVDLDKSLRAHHAQTVKLMATIDELRTGLQQEQARAKTLEQSNAALEQRAAAAERELGKAKSEAYADLDITFTDVKGLGTALGTSAGQPLGSGEVLSMEEDNLRLREELNATKKKVIALKQAAHQRKVAWQEELAKITEEIDSKRKLEEEVAGLKQHISGLNMDLRGTEDMLNKWRLEAERLQREVTQPGTGVKDDASVAHKAQEMEIISTKVSEQLLSVEQELTAKLRKSSELWELFLVHCQEPIAAIRRWCQDAAASGNAGKDLWMRQSPPMYSADVRNLKANLVNIVEILRYVAEVLAAYQPQGPEGGVISRLEESTEQAKEWLRSVLI